MKKENVLFSIGTKDLIKGFIVAVLTIVLTGLTTSLSSGELPTLEVLKTLSLTGLGAGIAYLLKNFLTDSKDSFLGSADSKPPTLPMILACVLLSTFAMADTVKIAPFDSAGLNNTITNVVNSGISLIPEPTPVVSIVKAIWMAAGTLITGAFMGFFIRRNKKKAK